MKAPDHPRQRDRLRLLADLGIMETGKDPAFDDLSRLASAICEVPISAVTLLDADRQWFKSSVGFGIEETSLDDAICSHAILEPDLLEIQDTRRDARTADNPLVTGATGLRFYAGAPLMGNSGLPLGTLCVLDTRPRTLTDAQRDALRVLARQAVMQIELRHALAEGEILRREVDHRVRNSLQLLASLTAIEGRRAEGEEARRVLETMRQRIGTIAGLHGRLHAQDAAGDVDVAAFLTGLLEAFEGLNPPGITVEARIDAISLPARQAASLGLLLNEFYTNSIKHAFADRGHGQISVRVTRMAPDRAMLGYRDDGAGVADGDAAGVEGLGSRVIDALASQLGGRLTRDAQPGQGLSLTVEFSIESD